MAQPQHTPWRTRPPRPLERARSRGCWAVLRDPGHGITFHFTPKHASWLNQIEIWFSILVRKLLRRGNFTSKLFRDSSDGRSATRTDGRSDWPTVGLAQPSV